jgi:hypothetical protein
VNSVDEGMAESWPAFGQSIKCLDDSSVRRQVECVDPSANLVNDINVPVGTSHQASLVMAIPPG